uniref:Uncharacterized protein n=1 Tax=Steinernema glaseri TaxID=37863 RepID=A0A1I8AIU4_9BILA
MTWISEESGLGPKTSREEVYGSEEPVLDSTAPFFPEVYGTCLSFDHAYQDSNACPCPDQIHSFIVF